MEGSLRRERSKHVYQSGLAPRPHAEDGDETKTGSGSDTRIRVSTASSGEGSTVLSERNLQGQRQVQWARVTWVDSYQVMVTRASAWRREPDSTACSHGGDVEP